MEIANFLIPLLRILTHGCEKCKLLKLTRAICLKQCLECLDALAQSYAVVAVGDIPAAGKALDLLGLGLDIGILVNCLGDALKGSVCLYLKAVRVVNECIARYAGRFLVRLAEAAVDDKQLAAGFDRAFALACLDRRMAVYDMPIFGVKAELVSIMRTARSSSQKLKYWFFGSVHVLLSSTTARSKVWNTLPENGLSLPHQRYHIMSSADSSCFAHALLTTVSA